VSLNEFSLIFLGLIGLGIGFVGGLVGLVLGVIRLPLVLGTEISAGAAAGTNIGISMLGSIAAAFRHFKQNNLHLRIFLVMAITGAIGAFLGSLLTKYVPGRFLLLIVGIIVLYESVILFRNSKQNKHTDLQRKNPENKKSVTRESLLGFGVGFLGGLVGLVLGSIRVPSMISILKMEPRVAVGTNLAASSVMGASGLMGHIIYGVDYLTLGIMGSTAMVGAYLGARYTNRFSPERLKFLIAIVLIIVAIFMFSRVFLE
jgi:hypothetical protein